MSNRDYDYDKDREGDYGYDRNRYGSRGRNTDWSRPDLPWLRQRNAGDEAEQRSFGGHGYGEDYGSRRYGTGYRNEDYERGSGNRGYGYGSGYGEGFERSGRYSGSHERDYPTNYESWSPDQGYGWRNRGYEGDDWQRQGSSGRYGNRDWRGQNWQGSGTGEYSRWQGQSQNWQNRGRFSGMGPEGYQRSDDRIKEDINDRLTQHGDIDASHINVQVNNGDVTLTGDVDDRWMKRMAEDVAESVSGVKDVRNELKTGHAEHRNQGQRGQMQQAA